MHQPEQWQDDKEFSGFAPSPTMTTCPTPNNSPSSPLLSYGSKDNVKLAKKLDSYTGNFVSLSPRRNLWPRSKRYLEEPVIVNSLDQKLPPPTSTKKKLQSKVQDLSLEPNPSEEMLQQIGNPYGMPRKLETWTPYLQTYEWSITGNL